MLSVGFLQEDKYQMQLRWRCHRCKGSVPACFAPASACRVFVPPAGEPFELVDVEGEVSQLGKSEEAVQASHAGGHVQQWADGPATRGGAPAPPCPPTGSCGPAASCCCPSRNKLLGGTAGGCPGADPGAAAPALWPGARPQRGLRARGGRPPAAAAHHGHKHARCRGAGGSGRLPLLPR